jgi:UrcA family protein
VKTLALGVLAVLLCAQPQCSHAETYRLDLRYIRPDLPMGQQQLEQWKQQVAIAYCGPVDMPQPLDLSIARKRCQEDVRADAQAQIDAAFARRETRLHYVLARR